MVRFSQTLDDKQSKNRGNAYDQHVEDQRYRSDDARTINSKTKSSKKVSLS